MSFYLRLLFLFWQVGAKRHLSLLSLWQCLRALDAISLECPDQCLRRGVAAAVLQFFDFFVTNEQVMTHGRVFCGLMCLCTVRPLPSYVLCLPTVCGNAYRKWRSRSFWPSAVIRMKWMHLRPWSSNWFSMLRSKINNWFSMSINSVLCKLMIGLFLSYF